jgi:hypothetical protein
MTKLLATRDSVAALAYARGLIERGHRDDEGSFFEAPHSRAFVHNIVSAMLLTTKGRLQLIAYAYAGEAYAQEALRTAIVEAQGELPPELVGYGKAIVAGTIPKPVTAPGHDPRDSLLRDIAICATVAAVCDRFNLKPTGRSVRRRSGSSVVGEGLAVAGRAMSSKQVEAIAKRFWRYMPPQRGWTFRLENQ